MNYSKLYELPIVSIKPEGWLYQYLQNQRNGLTGYLDKVGYPFNSGIWKSSDLSEKIHSHSWYPYEQTGYWIDGMIRCGYLLKDKFLINKAKEYINYVLAHPDSDGYLGPKFLKSTKEYDRWRWSHAVFFRTFIAEYSASKNKKILSALKKHYLSNKFPHSKWRDICNLEIILWLYGETKDKRLLKYAEKEYSEYNRNLPDCPTSLKNLLSDKRPNEHGVTYNETAKLGAILYAYTGRKKYLNSTINAYNKIDRDHMLIDGICSSSEYLEGKDPLDSHETCDIADYSWSVGYLLTATGKTEYADKIERACFNAAPGAVRSDFKALQYFSCPNQVIADRTSNHNLYLRGNNDMAYMPVPSVECCPGEVNRIMPNYVSKMWMKDKTNGLTALMYGPSKISTGIGRNNQKVTIIEETNYPFSEKINFRIKTSDKVRFTFTLRIPGWCKKADIIYNGKIFKSGISGGLFVNITQNFNNNDLISLVLPMDIKLTRWPKGGIGIERGPLVYSLKIEEDWKIEKNEKRSNKKYPAWNLYPKSAWNYALCLDKNNPVEDIKIINKPFTNNPWSIHTAPIELRVPVKRIHDWKMEHKKKVVRTEWDDVKIIKKSFKGKFVFTSQLPDPKSLKKYSKEKTEIVTLVPYGCSKLRVTIFPWVKNEIKSY
ncbi:MAG: hypothetical protein A2252_11675 [Elusimicrobia bacterium RIFOXYA2_FULL_39_19]|nr:MAG: hypothetical protein A2252_11675 [Elusimicrobia bacterium RIFOXYA2_FULL_39_19]